MSIYAVYSDRKWSERQLLARGEEHNYVDNGQPHRSHLIVGHSRDFWPRWVCLWHPPAAQFGGKAKNICMAPLIHSGTNEDLWKVRHTHTHQSTSTSMSILSNAVGITLRWCVTHHAHVETLLTALAGSALEWWDWVTVWCLQQRMVPVNHSAGEKAELVCIQWGVDGDVALVVAVSRIPWVEVDIPWDVNDYVPM